MKSRNVIMAGLVGGLALVAMPGTASAEPEHCPPGHAMKNWCGPGSGSARFRDDDRRLRHQDALDDAYDEGYRDALEDSGFRVGERLPRNRYRVLDRGLYYDRYGRRLDDRYYYAEADGERLLIEAATGAIVDLLLR